MPQVRSLNYSLCSCYYLHYKKDPEEHVNGYYKKETYLEIYNNQLFSIRNQEDWPHSGNTTMTKPKYKKQSGKLKKLRQLNMMS